MNKSELFKRTGRYEKAYELLEESYLIKDSISTLEATNTINELKTKYRTAEKDKQIAEQKAVIATRNTWLIVLGSACPTSIRLCPRPLQNYQAATETQTARTDSRATGHGGQSRDSRRSRTSGREWQLHYTIVWGSF